MIMLSVNTNESIRVTAETCNCIQTRTGRCNHYSNATVRLSKLKKKKKICSVKVSNRDHAHKYLVLEVQ